MQNAKREQLHTVPVTQIEDLRIFARVVTAGNMSAAGRGMALSPAVVSKRISGMEEKLGVRLFQRTTRQLKLTETGKGFYDRVVGILASIDEAEAFVSDGNSKPRGVLKIAAPTAFSRLHLAPHFNAFMKRFPDIQLDLLVTDAAADLVEHGADMAIRVGEMEETSLVVEKLAPCREVLCAAPEFLAASGIPKSIEDVQAEHCYSAAGQPVWRLEGPKGPVQIKVAGKVNLRTNYGEVLTGCITSGLGIGLAPVCTIYKALRSGELEIILPQYQSSGRSGVYAIYPRHEYLPAKIRVFIDFFTKLYGAHPYWEDGLHPQVQRLPVQNGLSK
jgi:DNA-binding transcriptional LysR family regulator